MALIDPLVAHRGDPDHLAAHRQRLLAYLLGPVAGRPLNPLRRHGRKLAGATAGVVGLLDRIDLEIALVEITLKLAMRQAFGRVPVNDLGAPWIALAEPVDRIARKIGEERFLLVRSLPGAAAMRLGALARGLYAVSDIEDWGVIHAGTLLVAVSES